jgi:hypothetical protein
MKSLQRPKKIKAMGSDGKTYSFLLKKEDDLRNDARTMEFFYMINYFLRKNPKSRDSDLCKCFLKFGLACNIFNTCNRYPYFCYSTYGLSLGSDRVD